MPVVDLSNRSSIVFLTVCAARRRPVLARHAIVEVLEAAWGEADSWLVGRYVLMPDHLHLFCAPAHREAPPLATWVTFWKSRASRRWPSMEEKPVWQRDFWDRQLRGGESYSEKWKYVQNNPVRAGLCAQADEWPFHGEMTAFRFHDA